MLIVKLKEFEIHTSEYAENRIKNDKIYRWGSLTEELRIRIHFRECEKNTSDFIESRIGDYPIEKPIDKIIGRKNWTEIEKEIWIRFPGLK